MQGASIFQKFYNWLLCISVCKGLVEGVVSGLPVSFVYSFMLMFFMYLVWLSSMVEAFIGLLHTMI